MGLIDFLFGSKPASAIETMGQRKGDAVVDDRSDFAARLFDRLAVQHAGKNLFLSPFSIQVALAMCAAGAKGETRKVLTDLIGAPESVDDQHRQYAELLKVVNGEGRRPFTLVTANALWGQKGYKFNPEFQQAVADFYDGALFEVDFTNLPDKAVTTINEWVSNKTRGMIGELINQASIDTTTRLILTNAIYFKGRWEKPFREAGTKNESWYAPSGTRQVPTMHRTDGYFYFENNKFQALELPYMGGQFGLLVVLPKRSNGLASLEAQGGTGRLYQQATAGLRYEVEVIVSFPRFKVEAEFSLKSVLSDMGAGVAFSGQADFGGISDVREVPLMISEVVHKAFVEVNEEGTEAAAATAVTMLPRSAAPMPVKRKVFKADHPFIFFIRDRQTNAVLFSGRLIDPK